MLPAWWLVKKQLLRQTDGNGEILLARPDYKRAVWSQRAVPAEYVCLNLIISFTMEREEVLVRFSDLRRLASSVPNYVAEKVGEDKLPTLKTAIEDDLGIVGLDTQELIFKFSEAYKVDLSKFDFTGCIGPEPSGNPLIFVLLPLCAGLFMIAWIANIAAALCYAPFSLQKAELMLKAGIGRPSTIARELLKLFRK